MKNSLNGRYHTRVVVNICLLYTSKKVADALQQFMGNQVASWGNEVSMELYGYEKFTAEDYFPIMSDGTRIHRHEQDKMGESTIKNLGFTKKTNEYANNLSLIHISQNTSLLRQLQSGSGGVQSGQTEQKSTTGTTPGSVAGAAASASQTTTASGTNNYIKQRAAYTPGSQVKKYQSIVKDYEGNEPDAFTSRYDGQIQNILNGILDVYKRQPAKTYVCYEYAGAWCIH